MSDLFHVIADLPVVELPDVRWVEAPRVSLGTARCGGSRSVIDGNPTRFL